MSGPSQQQATVPTRLSAIDQRVLGCLLEKQRTVPASYPLSLNGLRTAANQTSSRDPVSDYSEQQLTEALRGLKDAELVRYVWAGRGSRTLKYHQLLEEALGVSQEQLALVTVLLLRGPQSAGELRTRTERLHAFATKDDVDAQLHALADAGLVQELERRAGQQDPRWIHLLGPVDAAGPPPAEPAAGLEAILGEGGQARDAKVLATYDAVARAYAEQCADELAHKPFDAWFLSRVREQAGPGPILDLGSGPGHIASFLARDGAEVVGLDLSPQMVAVARACAPEVEFQTGDLRHLMRPARAANWSTILAWYALVHSAPSELEAIFTEWRRVLAPGGTVAFAIHVGGHLNHRDELLGVAVDVDFVNHDTDQVLTAATHADLQVREWYLRGPLPQEAPTERLVVWAGT